MKVVNRETFLTLPEGTIYAKGKPWYFEELSVKADTLGTNDWVMLGLVNIESEGSGDWSDRLERMLELGESSPLAQSYGRDGCFEADAVFLIYEKADLLKLRGIIDEAIVASA